MGGTLGLTPAKTKVRNLQVTKTLDTVEDVATRLDVFKNVEQSECKKHKKKNRRSQTKRSREVYDPSTYESLDLYSVTQETPADEEKGREDIGMSPLDDSDDAASSIHTEHDHNDDTPDEKDVNESQHFHYSRKTPSTKLHGQSLH